jgi:hypothetical protein
MDNNLDYIKEIKTFEKSIINEIKTFRSLNNSNSFKTEHNLRKIFEEYSSRLNKIADNLNSDKNSFPQKEYIRRYNEIQQYRQSYDKLYNEYENSLGEKYGYVFIIDLETS